MSNIISVTQFNTYIHNIFLAEEILQNISIYGEVSALSYSGDNLYFSIKDDGAVLNCVKFGYSNGYVPKEGEQVLCIGAPNYYIKGGRFSFNVAKIEPYGQGLLYQKFLEMKQKLERLGYFDPAKKKPLPEIIRRVGVVSSETGAVIRDIIDITGRRNPMLDVVLYPAKVQGIGAEATIIAGIKALDKTDVDVIIIARGGGSAEDLSTFNDEELAHAIFQANKPIISAVGHETDFTIADFVADLRAPTPSAAAELVTTDIQEVKRYLEDNTRRLLYLSTAFFDTRTDAVASYTTRLCVASDNIYNTKSMQINVAIANFKNNADKALLNIEHNLHMLLGRLENVNPIKILRMGYAQVGKNGEFLHSVNDADIGENVTINLIDGTLDCEIKAKKGKAK